MSQRNLRLLLSIIALTAVYFINPNLKNTPKSAPAAVRYFSAQKAAVPVISFSEQIKPDNSNASSSLNIDDPDSKFKVIKVIDGDTIQVENASGTRETVRLIGINTPETVDPRRKVQCFGKEASLRAKELLQDQEVYMHGDPTQTERDRYGRLLAYVYFSDGKFFNKIMIEEGFAYEYTYSKPYEFQKDFKLAEALAREEGRGLWASSTCAGVK